MLETPFTLPNGLVLANRLAKASTTEAMATRSSDVSEHLTTLYSCWAQAGAGLIVT